MNQPNPTQTPQMWRVASVARPIFGLSEDAFTAACDSGSLPIRLERVGARGLRMVRAAEVQAYVNAQLNVNEVKK